MAHLDCFDQLLQDRVAEMEAELTKCEENKKVLGMNRINRFQEWQKQFKENRKIYAEYSVLSEQLVQNVFDDDLVE